MDKKMVLQKVVRKGDLITKGRFFKNDSINEWIFNYTNGSKMIEGKYKDGVKNGEWLEYHHNGTLLIKKKYLNGKRNGPWEKWSSYGNKIAEGEYTDGIKTGRWRFWSDDNVLISDKSYINGLEFSRFSNGNYTENNFELAKKLIKDFNFIYGGNKDVSPIYEVVGYPELPDRKYSPTQKKVIINI